MMTIHAPGRLFMKTLVLTITLITSCFQTGFAQNKVFDIVRSGDLESLQKMPASSFVGEVRNADGYTVLQWLILHYVDYDLDRYYGDEEAMTNNAIQSDAYRSCMLHLLNNGRTWMTAVRRDTMPSNWQWSMANGEQRTC